MPTAVSRVWAGEGNADGTPAYEKKPCGCKAKGLNGCWYSVCAASVPLVDAGHRCKACHPTFLPSQASYPVFRRYSRNASASRLRLTPLEGAVEDSMLDACAPPTSRVSTRKAPWLSPGGLMFFALSTCRPSRRRRGQRERGARAYRPPETRWSAPWRRRWRRSPGRCGSPWRDR